MNDASSPPILAPRAATSTIAPRVAPENGLSGQRLVSAVAHELNGPLTPIRVQLHLIKHALVSNPSPELRRSLEIIETSVGRMQGLVSDLLVASRLEAGTLPVRLSPIDLASVVVNAAETMMDEANAKGIDLQVRVAGPLRVVADPDRAHQVLYNLLGNALKFTPRGGRVTISARQEHGRIMVEVCDDGLGMTSAQIGQLFQPFSRPHEATGCRIPGTGLGLHLCRLFVKAFGGSISASSPGPGKGTTFHASLPADHGDYVGAYA